MWHPSSEEVVTDFVLNTVTSGKSCCSDLNIQKKALHVVDRNVKTCRIVRSERRQQQAKTIFFISVETKENWLEEISREQLRINDQSHKWTRKRVKLRRRRREKEPKNRRNFVYFSSERKEQYVLTVEEKFASCSSGFGLPLFDFYRRVDFSYEDVWSDKANGTREDPEGKTDQQGIAEIQHGWNQFSNIKLGERIIAMKLVKRVNWPWWWNKRLNRRRHRMPSLPKQWTIATTNDSLRHTVESKLSQWKFGSRRLNTRDSLQSSAHGKRSKHSLMMIMKTRKRKPKR